MKVLIKETNEIKELNLIALDGNDEAEEFIEIEGGFSRCELYLVRHGTENIYACNQQHFEYWRKAVAAAQDIVLLLKKTAKNK